MPTSPENLTKKHHQLIHSDNLEVVSHQQRQQGEWFVNSIMVKGCEQPFKYKRTQPYRTLNKGQRINLTYYAATEKIADLTFDYFKVVRIRLS